MRQKHNIISCLCVASINQYRERACSHATRRFLSCTLTQRCDGADVVWSHNMHWKSHVASVLFFSSLFSVTLVSTSRIYHDAARISRYNTARGEHENNLVAFDSQNKRFFEQDVITSRNPGQKFYERIILWEHNVM